METGFYGFPGGAVPPSPVGSGVAITSILAYTLATDVTLAATSGIWNTIIADQSFTVPASCKWIDIVVTGYAQITSAFYIATRLLLDAAGTPQNKWLTGNYPSNTNVIGGTWRVLAPIAGSHTVRLEANPANGLTVYCRAATTNMGGSLGATREFCQIDVYAVV